MNAEEEEAFLEGVAVFVLVPALLDASVGFPGGAFWSQLRQKG